MILGLSQVSFSVLSCSPQCCLHLKFLSWLICPRFVWMSALFLYTYTYIYILYICKSTLHPNIHHLIRTPEVLIRKNQPKTAPQTHRASPWSISCLLPKFLPEEWMKSEGCPMVWMKLCLFIRSLFSGNNLLATRMLCYTTSSFLPGNLQFTHCTST